jgi:hypothetical protein
MKTIALDFTTPEGAVLMLENAYKRNDLEAAIAAKDFRQDAFYFLGLQFGSDFGKTEKLAAALETSFRRQFAEDGFPDYSNITTTFIHQEQVSPEQIIVTQRFERAGGHRDMRLLVVKTKRGWRCVLAPGFDTK